jgi:hypothetical protein
MGGGSRAVFIDDDGQVNRFSCARYRRLYDGDESAAVPEMRNKKVRFAFAHLETTNRRPTKVRDVSYLILPFDKYGRIDTRVEGNRRWIPMLSQWTPTEDIELAVRTAIFGNKPV